MMDQLASIGVEFDEATISRIFTRLVRDYHDMAGKASSVRAPPPPITSDDPIASADEPDAGTGAFCGFLKSVLPRADKWAVSPIFESNDPVRPWGLGQLLGAEGFMYKISGSNVRTPGLYKKVDPTAGDLTRAFLEDTNERVHSSVRVRLTLKGLGLNDGQV